MLVVILDTTIFPSLPSVILRKSLVKKLMIDLFNIVLHQNDILIGAGSINVFCNEFSVIMTDTSFTDTSTDSSLDVITLFPNASAIRRVLFVISFYGVSTHAFVTFAKVTQRYFCHS